jgi:hypothetical protein
MPKGIPTTHICYLDAARETELCHDNCQWIIRIHYPGSFRDQSYIAGFRSKLISEAQRITKNRVTPEAMALIIGFPEHFVEFHRNATADHLLSTGSTDPVTIADTGHRKSVYQRHPGLSGVFAHGNARSN